MRMVEQVLVLVVEDDPDIRMLVEETLADGGYAVATACTGEAAIDLLGARHGEIRAIVTDINFATTELTGWDVAHRARELNPTLAVVYMTGAHGHDWPSHGVPNSVILQKPFAPDQVTTAVSQQLNRHD
jgi:CheY-like chemotaxis protein